MCERERIGEGCSGSFVTEKRRHSLSTFEGEGGEENNFRHFSDGKDALPNKQILPRMQIFNQSLFSIQSSHAGREWLMRPQTEPQEKREGIKKEPISSFLFLPIILFSLGKKVRWPNSSPGP